MFINGGMNKGYIDVDIDTIKYCAVLKRKEILFIFLRERACDKGGEGQREKEERILSRLNAQQGPARDSISQHGHHSLS